MKHIISLSGGKDSTAMALWLVENEPRDYTFVCTPTGNELPYMIDHWANLESIFNKPIIRLSTPDNLTLATLIEKHKMIPNFWARFCTVLLKVEPMLEFFQSQGDCISYVGLRADEETRKGIYGSIAEQRFPLRDIGWNITDVWNYLDEKNISIPERTDCALCYQQRLGEWFNLLARYPDLYAEGEKIEHDLKHTFRSNGRDSFPAALKDLRKEFERGRRPRGFRRQMSLSPYFSEMAKKREICRACTL